MSTIRPPPLFRRLVDLDVFDDEVARIQALGICVGFCVFKQPDKESGGFFRPAGFGDAKLFAFSRK